LVGGDAAVLRPVVVTVVRRAVDDFLDEQLLADERTLAVVCDGLVAGDILDDDYAERAGYPLPELGRLAISSVSGSSAMSRTVTVSTIPRFQGASPPHSPVNAD
jgi:hypothetical protein